MEDTLIDQLIGILDRLVAAGALKAALLHDKSGHCLASRGDGDSMTAVADTHFGSGLDLSHLCRDEHGSTVLSNSSGDAVRLEAVADRYILTLVGTDPLMSHTLRARIDATKRELARRLVRSED